MNRRRGTPPTLLVAALLLLCASARGFSVQSLRRAIAIPSFATLPTRAPSPSAFAATPSGGDAGAVSNAERKAELLKRIKILVSLCVPNLQALNNELDVHKRCAAHKSTL